MTKPTSNSRKVFCLAFEDCQVLDVAGPLEALCKANELGAPDSYEPLLLGPKKGALKTTGVVRLEVDRAFGSIDDDELEGLDTLLLAGGAGVMAAIEDPQLMSFVRRAASRARRVASVCSGTFILAEAGLLEGRRATTHWNSADELGRRYPGVRVEPDLIYVRDGDVWSSAGVTAGIDMTLAMIEADLGQELALAVARQLVVYMMRPGGQIQFSPHLTMKRPKDDRLDAILEWIEEHAEADLSVPALAARCAMSERTFSRRFAAETGMTPARFVEQIRMGRARRLLEESDLKLERLADDCGFRSAEVMRRLFQRHLGLSPTEYRERFKTALRA